MLERLKLKQSSFMLNNKLSEFCNLSTIHGVGNWYKATSYGGKFIWALLVSCATISAIYGCVQICRQYQESPVVISYKIYHELSHKLPDMLICPFSRLNTSFIRDNNMSKTLADYIQQVFYINTPYRHYWNRRQEMYRTAGNISEALELEELMRRLGNITFDELIDLITPSCRSVIDYCVTTAGIMRDCCATAQTVLTPQSKCFRIAGRKQGSSGYGFGQTIVIRPPKESADIAGVNSLHNEGIAVKIVESGRGLDSDQLFIPTGVHALIPLNLVRYEFINDPPRFECVSPVIEGYSQSTCVDDCFFERAAKACRCRIITMTYHHFRLCTPAQMSNCIFPSLKMYPPKSFAHCKDMCKQSCDYWSFQPTVSYADFPSSTLFTYVRESNDSDWSRLIIVDIFLQKLEYAVIKHYNSMPYVSFMANLGGQLGIWTGASILSVAQCICFIASVAKIICQKLQG